MTVVKFKDIGDRGPKEAKFPDGVKLEFVPEKGDLFYVKAKKSYEESQCWEVVGRHIDLSPDGKLEEVTILMDYMGGSHPRYTKKNIAKPLVKSGKFF